MLDSLYHVTKYGGGGRAVHVHQSWRQLQQRLPVFAVREMIGVEEQKAGLEEAKGAKQTQKRVHRQFSPLFAWGRKGCSECKRINAEHYFFAGTSEERKEEEENEKEEEKKRGKEGEEEVKEEEEGGGKGKGGGKEGKGGGKEKEQEEKKEEEE